MGKEMSCLKSYILSAMLAEVISYGLQRKSAIGKQKLSERCFTSFLGFDGIKRSIRKARNGGYTMIIIRNGRVIDPKSQTDAIMNMAVDQGKIIAMGPDTEELLRTSPAAGTKSDDIIVLDAEGLVVAPGQR